MTSQPTTYAEPVTYNFNITFTRADEGHAHVYRSGVTVMAQDRATAERKLQARNAHLTVTDVQLYAVVNNDAEILEDYRQAVSAATDLARALDPNDPDFATRSAAEEMLSDELTAREQAVAVLRAQRDALNEALAEAQLDVREATTAWNALHSAQGLTNELLGAWLTSLTGSAPEIVDNPQDGDDKAVR